MKSTDIQTPYALPSAFAQGVYTLTGTDDFEIPANTSTQPTDDCVIDDGFLPITSTDLDDGGKAPERKNFNALFYLSTDQRVFAQNGGLITYRADVATKIGGYPQGAVLDYVINGLYYKVQSLIDDNSNNFVLNPALIDGVHWRFLEYGATTGANKDLSNLTTYGNSRLHALKGYLDNGELLTDVEGLTDVNYFATSDFDVNKFTKVGTPIISNDGVMTGISASNYVTVDTSNITYTNSFEIILPVQRTSIDNEEWIATTSDNVTVSGGFMLGFRSNNTLKFLASTGGGTYDIAYNQYSTNTLTSLDKYYLKLSWNGAKYVISHSSNLITWTEDITVDSSLIAPINGNNLRLGYGSGTAYFHGDYFLNESFIKADGKPVFTGNITGIDTVKPVNYTPVGSPTITDDGIATFAANKYITLPDIDVTGKTFEIDFGKITPNNVTTTQDILSGISSNLFTVGIAGSTSKFFATSTNWTGSITTDPLTADNDYYLKAGYDGTNAYLSLSADGINYTKTTVGLTTQFTTLSLRIGTLYNGSGPVLFPYDLNQFKIYVDNKLVYQPCLLIPYAKSSTGSKIVDSYYRDRVADVYAQYGVASYYTLSDTDFTLPMGEIYGLISKASCDYSKPDYAKAITKEYANNTEYIMEEDGWIWVQCEQFSNQASMYCFVNNTAAWRFQVNNTVTAAASGGIFPLSKGDTFRYEYIAYQGANPSVVYFKFMPIKKEYKNVL